MVSIVLGILFGFSLLGIIGYYILTVGRMIFFIGEVSLDSAKEYTNRRIIETKEQAVTTL